MCEGYGIVCYSLMRKGDRLLCTLITVYVSYSHSGSNFASVAIHYLTL